MTVGSFANIKSEIEAIRAKEVFVHGDYTASLQAKPDDAVRVAFVMPYGHQYSLLCMGPLSLYDLINRTPEIPATAERAIVYDSVTRVANTYQLPEGDEYVTIETASPLRDFDVIGLTITNSGDLPALFALLDAAGVPRRVVDREAQQGPLVVGGNSGFSNPEVFADYVDAVALGDAEESLVHALAIIHAGRRNKLSRTDVLAQVASVPGMYVPAAYREVSSEDGSITAEPITPTAPAVVSPQYVAADDLNPAHFVAPISDGTSAMIVPTLGCRWSCHFCILGVPDFRQAPEDVIMSYLDRVEELGIPQIIISSPTFTQYRHRFKVLDRIRAYAERASHPVSTIIGSVRADELSERYLAAVSEIGEFGHLFTELRLENQRGIVTVAPEFASEDLVRTYNKTMTRARVNKAIDMCRRSGVFSNIMLYFIIGAPGEHESDRLAIADYLVDTFEMMEDPDAVVILKVQQFMPTPNTVSQRLPMTHPDFCDGAVDRIADRLRSLVGDAAYEKNFRVVGADNSRLLLEALCMRGGRVVGGILEDLHDAGTDFSRLTSAELESVLEARGLDLAHFLREIELDEPLPWGVVNTVSAEDETQLMTATRQRTEGGDPGLAAATLRTIPRTLSLVPVGSPEPVHSCGHG